MAAGTPSAASSVKHLRLLLQQPLPCRVALPTVEGCPISWSTSIAIAAGVLLTVAMAISFGGTMAFSGGMLLAVLAAARCLSTVAIAGASSRRLCCTVLAAGPLGFAGTAARLLPSFMRCDAHMYMAIGLWLSTQLCVHPQQVQQQLQQLHSGCPAAEALRQAMPASCTPAAPAYAPACKV